MSITELADRAGLRTYDTALPQRWVDTVRMQTGKFPYGFVWGYDDSPMFGEPIPLTAEARALCREMLINPRNPKFLEEE